MEDLIITNYIFKEYGMTALKIIFWILSVLTFDNVNFLLWKGSFHGLCRDRWNFPVHQHLLCPHFLGQCNGIVSRPFVFWDFQKIFPPDSLKMNKQIKIKNVFKLNLFFYKKD